MSYTLIGAPDNRSFRVMWAMEELGLDYALEPARPGTEAVAPYNPSRKVPVLLVDGVPVIDSVAIVQFLADRHGAMTHPAGTLARAQQDSFTQFAVDEIEGNLWTAAKHSFALPEADRVPQVKRVAKKEFGRAMGVFAERLGGQDYVTGEMFTVPDLLMGHCARWARAAKFDLPQKGPVAAYFARIAARPALSRAKARAAEAESGTASA